MWAILGGVAAVLGALYGWHGAPKWGPPPVAALAMALLGAAAVGWVFPQRAEQHRVPAGRIAAAAVGGPLLATSIALAAGAGATATSLFAFLAFLGGIAVAIYPLLALCAALIGFVLGALDAAIPGLRPDDVRCFGDGLLLALKAAAACGFLAPTAWALSEKGR